jgi:hypothetical protein
LEFSFLRPLANLESGIQRYVASRKVEKIDSFLDFEEALLFKSSHVRGSKKKKRGGKKNEQEWGKGKRK